MRGEILGTEARPLDEADQLVAGLVVGVEQSVVPGRSDDVGSRHGRRHGKTLFDTTIADLEPGAKYPLGRIGAAQSPAASDQLGDRHTDDEGKAGKSEETQTGQPPPE